MHKIGNSGASWGPTHQSHKLIAAHKILAIQHDTFDDQPVTRFIFDGIPSVSVSDTELANKPKPEAGMYLVAYSDGYFSFSPAKQFEEGNSPIETVYPRYEQVSPSQPAGFGWAIKQLQNGARVRRSGWNGKGMFLFLVPGSRFKVNRHPLLGIYPEGTEIDYRSHIDMKTADGSIVPWVASQTDILGTDWEIAD